MPDRRLDITLGVTAHNEAATVADTLRSLLHAVRVAEAELPLRFRVVVVLDDCADETGAIARTFPGVDVVASTGGLVEAQRRVANSSPFVVFSDADILVGETALAAVCRVMIAEPSVQVAYPRKRPLAPHRRTPLARALHCYNRVSGFQESRRYFNGRFFAIRDWRVPTLEELWPRLVRLPPDNFYVFHAGMRVDDIYLSRDILRRYGADAIREVAGGEILFRPPETFAGMYHTYRRMRLEIERLDVLFPETIHVHQRRRYERAAEQQAALGDRLLWRWFRTWLGVCKARYVLERFYYRRIASRSCPAWPAVRESKVPLCIDTVRRE